MRTEPGENGTLDGDTVRIEVQRTLERLIPEDFCGYSANRTMLIDTLIYAAMERCSLHQACGDLGATADDDTLRLHLNALFSENNIHSIQIAINKVLQSQLPRRVRRGRRDIAIDIHDQPYYGKNEALKPWVRRSKSKQSTTRFLSIASAYVIENGIRVTVSMCIVRPTQKLEDLVSWLVYSLRSAGIGLKRLWLDREFASVGVAKRLEAMRITAVIACPIRGGTGGTRALCKGRKTYGTTHTFSSRRSGRKTVYISVVRAYQTKKSHRKAVWLLYIQIGQRIADRQVRQGYRSRFGIESSYRDMNRVRIQTTSRNPAVRYLFMGIGLIILNIWTVLKHVYCTVCIRGKKRIDHARFRLSRMSRFARDSIGRIYRAVNALDPFGQPICI